MNPLKELSEYSAEVQNDKIYLTITKSASVYHKVIKNICNQKELVFTCDREFIICMETRDGQKICIDDRDCRISGINTLEKDSVVIAFEENNGAFRIDVAYQIVHGQYIKKNIAFIPYKQEIFLRDVTVEELEAANPLLRGGEGQPVFMGNELFLGLESPTSQNCIDKNRGIFKQIPGAFINKNQTWKSYDMIYGLNRTGKIEDAFRQYIREYRIRSKDKNPTIYCDWGLHDELSDHIELTDALTDGMLKHLKGLKDEYGIKFQYYLIDAFWFEENNPYIQFKSKNWPDGVEKVRNTIQDEQMKLGLWFDLTGAFLKMQTMKEARFKDGEYALCLGHKEYLNALRQALLFHICINKVKMIKFDFAIFECSNPLHAHLPGYESKEYLVQQLLILLKELREEEPELIVLAYNGFTTDYKWIKDVDANKKGWAVSPWWAFHIDYIYCGDPRPSETPTVKLRDSVHYYTDAMIRQFHDSLLPFETIDDHGIMIGRTGTIYYLGKDGWRDNWILSLSRGNRKIHFYGDLRLLDAADNDFLKNTWHLFDKICSKDYETEFILGNPLYNEIYGYHNGNEKEGYITVINPFPQHSQVELSLPNWKEAHAGVKISRIYSDGIWFKETSQYELCENVYKAEVMPFSVTMFRWETLGAGSDMLSRKKEFCVTPVLTDYFLKSGEELHVKFMEIGMIKECKFLVIKFKDLEQKPLRTLNGIPDQIKMQLDLNGSKYNMQPLYENGIWSGISWMVLNIPSELQLSADTLLTICSASNESVLLTLEVWNHVSGSAD